MITRRTSEHHEHDPLEDGISSISLIQQCGSDNLIAACARVSYANDLNSESSDKNFKLIKYMLKHGHNSPFEHNVITFRITAPLFVVQQMLRHRIGVSFNQQSARYTKLEPKFYQPEKFRRQDTKNKQSSSHSLKEPLQAISSITYKKSILESYKHYSELIEAGVCREQARALLPHCTYTSLYITFNLRSLMRFLDLRLAPNAQEEIQRYAQIFKEIASQFWPLTFKVLNKEKADEPIK